MLPWLTIKITIKVEDINLLAILNLLISKSEKTRKEIKGTTSSSFQKEMMVMIQMKMITLDQAKVLKISIQPFKTILRRKLLINLPKIKVSNKTKVRRSIKELCFQLKLKKKNFEINIQLNLIPKLILKVNFNKAKLQELMNSYICKAREFLILMQVKN